MVIGQYLDPNGNYSQIFPYLYHSDLQKLFCVSSNASYLSMLCEKGKITDVSIQILNFLIFPINV